MSHEKTRVSDKDKYYVLVTGANSGLGYSICERLISEFLLTRPANQHLHLIPSTRSQAKTDETVRRLQQHIEHLVAGPSYKPVFFRTGSSPPADFAATPSLEARSQFAARVTLDPVLVDLCDLASVFSCADKLAARVPRLDVLIANAGIGGWDGLSWMGMLRQFFTQGPVATVSRPNYKICRVGAATKTQVVLGDVKDKGDGGGTSEPVLGEVFCANVFGHYLLVRACLPLLSRNLRTDAEQARVVWIGTGEALKKHFDVEDMQGLKSSDSYEASKRLIDILILGPNLDETAARLKQQYLTIDSLSQSKEKDMEQSLYIVSDKDLASSSPSPSQASINSVRTTTSSVLTKAGSSSSSSTTTTLAPPQMYVAHPGVCLTSILPLSAIMTGMQLAVIYLARWLGSIWHVNTSYKGATSAVWLATESSARLAQENAMQKKWGSMCDRWGTEGVIETPMEGYGVAGEEAEEEIGDNDGGQFGESARRLWIYMEDLRKDWTERVQRQ